MAKEMPKVIECGMDGCAYNTDRVCRAMAINVSHGSPCAVCRTCIKQKTKGGVSDMTAAVGACNVPECRHNEDLECQAPDGIRIDKHRLHAVCKTFMVAYA